VYQRLFGVRVAPAHDEPRRGPNNSERESTSGRSTDYGSGHLIRVFRDIGRMFSLLFSLSQPSPVGHQPIARVQSRKTEYGFVEGKNGFICVSCGTSRRAGCHSPEREPRRDYDQPVVGSCSQIKQDCAGCCPDCKENQNCPCHCDSSRRE
jgi:hypothetical protein